MRNLSDLPILRLSTQISKRFTALHRGTSARLTKESVAYATQFRICGTIVNYNSHTIYKKVKGTAATTRRQFPFCLLRCCVNIKIQPLRAILHVQPYGIKAEDLALFLNISPTDLHCKLLLQNTPVRSTCNDAHSANTYIPSTNNLSNRQSCKLQDRYTYRRNRSTQTMCRLLQQYPSEKRSLRRCLATRNPDRVPL